MDTLNTLISGIWEGILFFLTILFIVTILVLIPTIFCLLDLVWDLPEFLSLVLYYCILFGIFKAFDDNN